MRFVSWSAWPLMNAALLRDEDALDEVRVDEQVLVARAPAEARDVAVGARHALERADRVAVERDDRPARDEVARARWLHGDGHAPMLGQRRPCAESQEPSARKAPSA